MTLLSARELRAIQEVAELGMVTPITIYRRTTTANAYGDAEQITYPKVGTAKGWLYSDPTPVAVISGGQVAIVNTYRLYLPIGTDIAGGDRVGVEGRVFTVSDTTAESTWPALLNVSLRGIE